jgi:hypothetical protein
MNGQQCIELYCGGQLTTANHLVGIRLPLQSTNPCPVRDIDVKFKTK